MSQFAIEKCAAEEISSFKEWQNWALAEDERSGANLWKREDRSDLYDYKIIRRRYDELKEVRLSGDADRLLFYLNEGLHGNMGGMGAPGLYTHAKVGTKDLIENYVDELVGALNDLEESTDLKKKVKRAYFRRASTCYGRSALMFSGAGSLGSFHVGVAKTLLEQDLMPKVISGASAGSVVTAILGTRNPDRMAEAFKPDELAESFQALPDVAMEPRSGRIRLEDLKGLIESAIPDMTFIEAYEETGKLINISVSPSELHQRSRMLNSSTSPNACIREAVLASCAIPGIFPPVTLAAKDSQGKRCPYVPSRQWVDGSITDDIPTRRIARQYGVNHFISSQANPIVLWALQNTNTQDLFSRSAAIYQTGLREWLRAIYPFVMENVRNIYPLNTYTRFWFSLITQEYSADINILPDQRFLDPAKLLANLSVEETDALIREGERETWPKVEMIRTCTKISKYIDGALLRLQGPYAMG